MNATRHFLGRGFAFPLAVDPQGRIAMASEDRLVQQSIWVILSTARGEMQRNPRFGCGIQQFLFADNTPATRAQIAHQVRDALLAWERRIDLIDVRVEEGEQRNMLLIGIDYRLRANHAFGSMVYPFHLLDGEG
jgi:phage baseplate assembly protein W